MPRPLKRGCKDYLVKWTISIDLGPQEQKETLKGVAEGEVDILIGTHRIVGKDVSFKDLGLLIIDENRNLELL